MVFQNTYRGFFYRQIFVTPQLITTAQRSLVGKTGIVTGSNTGLGYFASSQLLSLGLSRLILAVRDANKGEAAKTSLLKTLKESGSKSTPTIEVWSIDMTDFTSITTFANRVRDTPDLKVDFAILNAGVARFGFEKAPNGNELTIQTNWLGTGLLAIALRPILQNQYKTGLAQANGHASSDTASRPPVISIVGSEVAQWAQFKERKMAIKDKAAVIPTLNDKNKFVATDRYYTSKLLLSLFFQEFIKRLPADNDVVVNIVNPGFCYGSELHRTLTGGAGKVFGGMKRMIGRSTEVGARTLTHGGAVAGKESHGKYLSDEKAAPFMDWPLSAEGQKFGRELWGEMEQEFAPVFDVSAALK